MSLCAFVSGETFENIILNTYINSMKNRILIQASTYKFILTI